MFEIVSRLVLLFFLFVMAWKDYKTQLIEIWQLLIMGVIGIVLCGNQGTLWQAMGGAFLGVIILLVAWCSKEYVGFGDGYLFMVTGIFLGVIQNFALFFASLFLAGSFAIACLVLKKKKGDDRMALGPFVLTAYVLFIL